MKENIYKILFSGIVLVLTFWGRSNAIFFPVIGTGTTAAGRQDAELPKFKNKIYAVTSAELLAGQENDVGRKDMTAALLNTNYVIKPAITGGTELINVQAGSWLVGNLSEEKNTADHNLGKRRPIASLSKLMTASIALENIPKNQLITISDSAVQTEGTAGGFKADEVMTSEDLLKALMLASSNDAAVALAEYLGREKFVGLMNAKATALHMADTFFKEPTGLSPLNQSTIHDLKILVRYISETHPEILAYSRLSNAEIFDTAQHRKRVIKNINLFAGRPDFLGGKTGYTDDAGENLISLFARQNKIIVVIVLDVLGGKNRFDESLSALQQFDKLDI